MTRPLCFVLMPFGTKPDGTGMPVDFDAVYRDLIAPAIADAGMEPLRADEEDLVHSGLEETMVVAYHQIRDIEKSLGTCGVSMTCARPRSSRRSRRSRSRIRNSGSSRRSGSGRAGRTFRKGPVGPIIAR